MPFLWGFLPNPWYQLQHSFLHRKLCLYDWLSISSNDLIMLWLWMRGCLSSKLNLMLRSIYVFNILRFVSMVSCSSWMALRTRFLLIWVVFLSVFVLWLQWCLWDYPSWLFLGKWCHGLDCFWCMSGRTQFSLYYLEVISVWFISGEKWWDHE